MLNRTKPGTSDALESRRALSSELRDALNAVLATPFDWSNFDAKTALGEGEFPSDLRLVGLMRLLCTAPARSSELRALWNESVATAAYALRIAPRLRADPNICAIAGLLHRLGDLLTVRAIGMVEHESRIRLDAASKADLCAEHGNEQLERVVRAWGVPPRAAATAAEWRRLREFPGAAAEATVVYLARLFAIALLTPQFCAPGVMEHAIEEAGLDGRMLDELKGDPGVAALLQGLQPVRGSAVA